MQHPSQILFEEDTHLIRSYSLIAEGQGALTPAQLQLIYDRKWFKVMVPEYAGGLELSLPEVMRLLEAAAWADGSFGWVLNLGAGANMFAAFLPVEIAKKLFIHPEFCIAGSGTLSGKAEKIDRGYILMVLGNMQAEHHMPVFFRLVVFLLKTVNRQKISGEDLKHGPLLYQNIR